MSTLDEVRRASDSFPSAGTKSDVDVRAAAAMQAAPPGVGAQYPHQLPHMPVHPYNAPAMYPTSHIQQTDTRPWYEMIQGLSLESRNGN